MVGEGGYENQGQEQARFTRWQVLLHSHLWRPKVCPLRQIIELYATAVRRNMLT